MYHKELDSTQQIIQMCSNLYLNQELFFTHFLIDLLHVQYLV